MIKKLTAIHGIGRFHQFNAAGDCEFRRLTLIYSGNGLGKSTLCNILRSLATGRADYIQGRRTLGRVGDAVAKVLLDTGLVTFTNDSWTATCPDLLVYDSTFVHENVFSGDFIRHDHRRNLYQVVIGARGVELAETISRLDAESREVTSAGRDKKSEIQQAAPRGTDLDSFLNLAVVPDVEIAIASAVARRTAAENAQTITAKESLSRISLPSLPDTLRPTLATTLTDVANAAEATVRTHIEDNHPTEAWISTGLAISTENCPFCGQAIAGLGLIAAYRSFFSEGYRTLRATVADLRTDLTSAFSDDATLKLQAICERNGLLVQDFWSRFVAETELPFDEELALRVRVVRDQALREIDRKANALLESIVPSTAFDGAEQDYGRLVTAATVYNAEVDRINLLISDVKRTAAALDLRSAVEEVVRLEKVKARFESNMVILSNEYAAFLRRKQEVEGEKQQAKADLEAYSVLVIEENEDGINRILGKFGAEFRIANSRTQYPGGSASAAFNIVIQGIDVELGDDRTPLDQPSFRNTLSAGDKNTLALAFFIATLERDPELASKIIVFDDPFTSLDRTRRMATQQIICSLATKAKQIVVLSHDVTFLSLVWEHATRADVRTLQIRLSAHGSVVDNWDVQAAGENDYAMNYRKVQEFVSDPSSSAIDTVRSIRPALEGRLRMHFPESFGLHTTLGDMIAAIREANSGDVLATAGHLVGELTDLNEYSRRPQHGAGAATVDIDTGELLSFARRTITVLEGL